MCLCTSFNMFHLVTFCLAPAFGLPASFTVHFSVEELELTSETNLIKKHQRARADLMYRVKSRAATDQLVFLLMSRAEMKMEGHGDI